MSPNLTWQVHDTEQAGKTWNISNPLVLYHETSRRDEFYLKMNVHGTMVGNCSQP
jgi:hypothetical protein